MKHLLRNLQRNPNLYIGGFFLLFFVFVALLAPLIASDPNRQNVINRLQAPNETYWFGTDEYGRNLFARVVYGARTTLVVSLLVTLLASFFGLLIGLLAGYYKRLDGVLMRIMDGLMAFPAVILALGLVAVLGPQLSNTVIALSLVYAPRIARLVRGVVLSLGREEYITAAKALGAGDKRILFFHITRNLIDVLIVQISYVFALAIIAESALSFLGVAGSAEGATWGGILSDGRRYIYQAAHMSIIPGVAISLTVLSLNLLGDGLQEALDPRMKRSGGL